VPDIAAVLFDFGGVILSSPFEAFAEYERHIGAPIGLIRTINSTNSDTNAWAQLERSDVTIAEFIELFDAEAIKHAGPDVGGRVSGRAVLGLIDGEIRPAMVEAIRRCKKRFAVACLTNNVSSHGPGRASKRVEVTEVLAMFDHVVESSKVGVRKPELAFYEAACELVGVKPDQCVFLDDLGVNLKPAAAMGMHTIKVIDPDDALAELESVLGISLR
jgi:putative hydrolase of the HAD superfamily